MYVKIFNNNIKEVLLEWTKYYLSGNTYNNETNNILGAAWNGIV